MKAIIISQPGLPEVLQWVDVPEPIVHKNEVLIQVKAAGVNRPDIAQREGKYPPPPDAPQHIPGLEVAGIVKACGKEVLSWKIGDEVCALVAGGGYAEYVAVNEKLCLRIPENLNFIQAASLPETVFTVWNNVFQRASLKTGESLLVHGGSSGIGITAIQLAKAFGAQVYATAGSEEKCKACLEIGADICINYKEEDFEERLSKLGVDVILDMIGGDYVNKGIRLLRPDGRMVFINAMKGSKIELNIHQLMSKRLLITGSTLRSRDIDFKSALAKEVEKEVWPIIESGLFKPFIYATFPLQEASKAHRLMESSEHIGKIILTNEE